MKLNYNVWHAKLYRYYYPYKFRENQVNNLCPYFWSLLLIVIPLTVLCYIITLPYFFVYNIISFIYKAFTNERFKIYYGESLQDYFVNAIGSYAVILFSILGLFLTSVIYAYLYGYFPKATTEILVISTFINGLWAFLILSQIFKFLKKRFGKKSTEPDTSSFKYITKEFFKAKYYKYCPKIEWVKKD